MRIILAVIGAICICGLLLTGCVTDQQAAAADYGPAPSAEVYETKIKTHFENVLKDPESARYKFYFPTKGWVRQSGQLFFGWHVAVKVNAKNSFGGYTGDTTHVFFFTNAGHFLGEVNPITSGAYIGG